VSGIVAPVSSNLPTPHARYTPPPELPVTPFARPPVFPPSSICTAPSRSPAGANLSLHPLPPTAAYSEPLPRRDDHHDGDGPTLPSDNRRPIQATTRDSDAESITQHESNRAQTCGGGATREVSVHRDYLSGDDCTYRRLQPSAQLCQANATQHTGTESRGDTGAGHRATRRTISEAASAVN
jgi:hypothetical protein